MEGRLRQLGVNACKATIDKDNTLIRAQGRANDPELEERLRDLSTHF
jgi:hypothetical protein